MNDLFSNFLKMQVLHMKILLIFQVLLTIGLSIGIHILNRSRLQCTAIMKLFRMLEDLIGQKF